MTYLPRAVALVGLLLVLARGVAPIRAADDRPAGGDRSEVLAVLKTLTKTDPIDKVRAGSAHHVHRVRMEAGKTYIIDMKSREVDAFLRLEDAAGKQLDQDDDGGDSPDARIVFPCQRTDTYQVVTTTFKAETYGKYALTIEKLPTPAPGRLQLQGGRVEAKARLTPADPPGVRGRKRSHAKVYEIKLSGGKTYQIDMVSRDLDSYLVLESADGKVLDRDDDSGGMLNARITFACPKDAIYRVTTTTLRPNTTGNFTLSVQEK
jgi:serine protease Do